MYRHQLVLPATADTLLVLQIDGKGIVMRREALRPATFKAHQAARRAMRTRLGPGEKPHRERMATLACVFDTAPSPRRPHGIVAPPTGPSHEPAPRPGPKATAKWLTGSVVHPPEHTIAAAFDQAEAHDPAHVRTWVVLVDGARHQLELIHAVAARRRVTVHGLLDIVHVGEYLWTAAHALPTMSVGICTVCTALAIFTPIAVPDSTSSPEATLCPTTIPASASLSTSVGCVNLTALSHS
ncbi:hypothetical protein JHN63_11015 [Streptomyces sp. MBT65]|nr:hypothetical protein [Streptomyces sp. MBT65]